MQYLLTLQEKITHCNSVIGGGDAQFVCTGLWYSLVPNRRAGLFVKTAAYFAYRCVCCGQVRLLEKYNFRIYWATRIAHIRLSLVYLGDYIFAHSSVRVNTNSLLECGPRIRYMYTNT